MTGKPRLTLKDAIKLGRLNDFMAQEEARGISAANHAEFDAALAKATKPQQSKRQTSRSLSLGGSRGK